MGPHPPRKDLQGVISTWVGAVSVSPNHSPSPPPSPCPGSPVSRLTAHSGLLTCKPHLVCRALGFRGRGVGLGRAPQAGHLASFDYPWCSPAPVRPRPGNPNAEALLLAVPLQNFPRALGARGQGQRLGLGKEELEGGGKRSLKSHLPRPPWCHRAIIFRLLINTAGPRVSGCGEGVTGRTSRPEEARSSAHTASCSGSAEKGTLQGSSCGHASPPPRQGSGLSLLAVTSISSGLSRPKLGAALTDWHSGNAEAAAAPRGAPALGRGSGQQPERPSPRDPRRQRVSQPRGEARARGAGGRSSDWIGCSPSPPGGRGQGAA